MASGNAEICLRCVAVSFGDGAVSRDEVKKEREGYQTGGEQGLAQALLERSLDFEIWQRGSDQEEVDGGGQDANDEGDGGDNAGEGRLLDLRCLDGLGGRRGDDLHLEHAVVNLVGVGAVGCEDFDTSKERVTRGGGAGNGPSEAGVDKPGGLKAPSGPVGVTESHPVVQVVEGGIPA